MNKNVTYKDYWGCIKSILLSAFKDRRILTSFFLSLIFLGVEVGSNIAIPLVLKEIIDQISVPMRMKESLSLILISYGFLWIMSRFFLHIRSLLIYRIEQRLTFALGINILSHLYSLSLSYFMSQKPGELTNIIRRAQRDVPSLILGLLFHMLPTVIEFLCVILFISLFYPISYSFLMSCTLIAFFAYTSISMKTALENREKANEVDQNADGIVTDWLSNYEAIKVFGKQSLALKRCEEQLKKRELSEVTFMTHLSLSRLGQSLILGLGFTALTYLVGQGVQSGELTVGDFVLFNGYILQFILPVSILGQVTQDIKKAIVDMKGIIEILLTQSEVQEIVNPISLPPHFNQHKLPRRCNQGKTKRQIEFKNVSFAYKERSILEDLSFTINHGETVLIMGPTGQGKSTIAKLLLRLYDPTEGQIYIHKIDLKKISFQSLSQTMGWIPQESYLLNDTIENNLKFVQPNASRKELEEVLDYACLLDFITQLPQGLQTPVGNRGLKLSGGEKQRLSLARLFLQKPSVGIFDEATSFLDRNTELMIQDNINHFFPNMTKVIITHRPFMMEKAHQVINLDKRGQKIIHNNTHSETKRINSN